METWSNLCRSCLRPDSEVAILSNLEDNVKDKFFETTSIEVTEDDGLPQKLCTDCYTVLNSAYTFRQQCIRMDVDLKTQLESLLAKEAEKLQNETNESNENINSIKQLESLIKHDRSDNDDDYYYVVVIDEPNKDKDDEVQDPELEEMPEVNIKQEQHETIEEHDEFIMDTNKNFESTIESFIIDNNKVPDNVPATILENEEESQHEENTNHSENYEMEIEFNPDSNSQTNSQDLEEVDINNMSAVNKLLQSIPNSQNSSIIKILTTNGEEGPILLKSGNNITYLTTDGVVENDGEDMTHEQVILCDDESQLQIMKDAYGSELVIEYADEGDIATVVQQEDGSFLCPCGESFTDLLEYEAHQSTHTESNGNTCQMCGKVFESPEILTGHMFLHKNSTGLLVNCPFCLTSVKRNSLTQHIKYSHNNMKPTCNICSRTFANPNNLKRHMVTHTGEKEFQCNICFKRFAQKITMQTHRLTHINVGERRVSAASKTSESDDNKKSDTKKLMDTVKQEVKGQNGKMLGYACSLCKRIFSVESALEEHVSSMHVSDMFEEEEVLCSECGDIMPSKKALTEHMAEHRISKVKHTGRRFECSTCGKCCSSQAMLLMHERVHTNERPYPCQLCSLKFKTKTHLRTHQLTHTREKRFGCSICMKFFALKGNLVVHLRTHTGERPYACDMCEETFIDSKYLKKHKAKKHLIPIMETLRIPKLEPNID